MNAPFCREFEPLLSPYMDGELDEKSARRVEAHVATCARCRATLAGWQEAEDALAAAVPVRSDVEWERLARRVEAALDSEEEEAGRRATAGAARSPAGRRVSSAGTGRHWWLWSGSGALVATALVLLFWPWIVRQPVESPAILSKGGRVPSPSSVPLTPELPSEAAPTPSEREEKAAPPEGITPSGMALPAPPEADRGSAPRLTTPVDVRRVAVGQEARGQGALLHDEPAAESASEATEAPIAAAPDESALLSREREQGAATADTKKSEAASPVFPAREPEGGALSRTELQGRFATLSGEPRSPATSAWPAPEAVDRTRMVREPSAAVEAPAIRPRDVLAWATARRDAGDTAAAAEAFAMLTGEFPGNDCRADAWLGLVRVRAAEALEHGDEAVRLDAAAVAEGWLRAFPAHGDRQEVLASRARLWIALASADPDRWCPQARTAHDEWRREASLGSVDDVPDLEGTCAD